MNYFCMKFMCRNLAFLLFAFVPVLAVSAAEPGTSKAVVQVAPAPVPVPQTRETPKFLRDKKLRKHVVFISLAPSPYSNRHDCMRAGFGIYLLLKGLIDEYGLPVTLEYYDGVPLLDDRSELLRVMGAGDVFIMGGSTWGQGPAYYVRRFFELGGSANLMGASGTAWATAGGSHTGGAEVVHSFMRSMMGQGANVFTMAQKYMVFTTDERLQPSTPGEFSKLDMWYMDQFARMIIVQSLAGGNRFWARQLGEMLGSSPLYFLSLGDQEFPPPESVLNSYDDLRNRINGAADPESEQWAGLQALLANGQ